MVPSAIVVLDELPMTPNGKVDRKNLPAPTANADRVYTAPRTDLEEALAGLWAEVLNAKEVGIHDNFFEVGGHSLLATQLISRVRDTFKVDLAVRSLFEATTVAEQAEVLVKAEIKPGLVDKIAKVLLKVQRMSADEAKQALASKK
jgi:acyl carrier protein